MTEKNFTLWDRKSRLIWTAVLFFGCLFVYCTRTTMSICAVEIGRDLGWDKRISGFVMSAFFFGYILTQILGGILADRYGGDRTMYKAACVWSTCTILTPFIGKFIMLPDTIGIAVAQVLAGVAQGVHFPSLASLVGRRISDEHRNSAFSFACSGTMVGSLLTGLVGSLILEYFGWQKVFVIFGALSIFWAIVLRFLITMERIKEERIVPLSEEVVVEKPHKSEAVEAIYWKKVISYRSFWALLIVTFCESCVFTNLISWLPTYFRERHPKSQPWVYNVLPWICNFLSSNISGILSDRMVSAGVSLTRIRKLFVSLALFSTTILCIVLSHVKSFHLALILVALVCFFLGCNSSGIGMNPQDLMPNNAGVMYGIMNTAGAVSGMAGVSLVGHVLHATQEWSNVFILISSFSFSGGLVFLLFGSGQKII